ncbi:peptidoglycan-binding domain-containing protein [Cellulosimicrobium sp. PMB13]|uniref:peptidoglycan-binding domain-containing protein n=1 Tax=Cellulosimicrobium sp. PMB13 TaxID=3120158 RepID=UPI003F4C671C
MHRRPDLTDESRPGSSDRPDATGTRVASRRAAPRGTRAALPWGAVVAGAGAVTIVVAAAGMVGAATGGSPPVVVPASASEDWDAGSDPAVVPRPDEPRPVVTRIPPPEPVDEEPAPRPSSTTDRPAETPAVPPVAEPAPAPTGSAPTTPTPAATPTPSPDPTAEPDAPTATWVQERLRVHGLDVEVTGTLDDATVAALRVFQEARGLTADGRVGTQTRAALAAAPQESGGGEETSPPPTTEPTEPTTPTEPTSPGSTTDGEGAAPSLQSVPSTAGDGAD